MIVLEEKLATVPTLFVEKRDGRRVVFDVDKIDKALHKAAEKVMDVTPLVEKRLNGLVERIVTEIHSRFPQGVKIYEIQNVVEHELLEAKEYALAEEYITYRTQRDFERSKATDINFSIHKLLNKDQAVVNENANKDSDVFNTQRDLTAGIVGKSIGLQMLPKHVANAHQKGDIHYHDLDYSPYTPMTNCCLIDFKGMLENGFKIGNAEVESLSRLRPLRFHKSSPTLLLASTGAAQLTVLMKSWLRMRRRITKSTSRMPKSGSYLINGKITLGRKPKKTSTMPCNLLSMKSTLSSLQMDKHLLLR